MDVAAHADNDEANARVTELREFSKDLTTQALALLPVQTVLAAAVGASATRAEASDCAVNISIITLALSFMLSASALSRVPRRPAWTVSASRKTCLWELEARKLARKGLAVALGAWALLFAVIATAVSAAIAL